MGATVYAAPGEAHTYSNSSNRPATFLLVVSPAGFEQFFVTLVNELNAQAGPPDMGLILELNQQFGVTMIEE